MSTLFSVNLNKLALIRNSRGSNYPNLLYFVQRMIDLGVKGFTVHPRPDERHIKYQDVYDISQFLQHHPDIEFNIEGNPNDNFMALIHQVQPHQCTLVPDSVDQLTSDHGYDITRHGKELAQFNRNLTEIGVRCAVFVDPDVVQVQAAIDHQISAIELYTEDWARQVQALNNNSDVNLLKKRFQDCIHLGNDYGLRVNAGHDLNLTNLAELLALGNVAEVSIGHAFTIECIEQGIDTVVAKYLAICQ